MKRLIRDLLKSVGLYLLVVVGGILCFLSFAPVFGYLPYSDRPDPGWFGRFPGVTWPEFWHGVWYFLGWVALLTPYAVIAGVVLFIIARVLERVRTPRIVVAVVAAIIAGFVSGYIVAGIGWYIAIAAPPVYFAMILGVIFGACLLPRSAVARGRGV